MNTESQISVDIQSHPNPVSVVGGDLHLPPFISNDVPQQPVKKTTRQWAAWTHEEEESFFNALRQVGKDFDKITCRVQSKNKDQVRHYYYRLVRRMNKLLGPGLCLDAKNSKDTNAAMLRWWSLLEKYSCKASKLHLKPRRFKIFIEALELQLLKDRKKSVKKRLLQGENCPPPTSGSVSDQSRASGNDTCSFRLVLVDSQNIPKFGPVKASSKRNVNMGVNRSNNKGESNIAKPSRQRRRTGTTSEAAYKKWEKAAIAGVSLVADAAEHLERTVGTEELETDHNIAGQKCSSDIRNDPASLPTCSKNIFVDNRANNRGKLKLQLFPIDDGTRRALEMDKHNPYLELTLSTKKRISSVLEHLNKKWGNSSVAVGELMLFPYNTENENSIRYQRWTQDSILSAADVYTILGSPQVFRLRYGWFPNSGVRLTRARAPMASTCMLGLSNNSNHTIARASTKHQVTGSAPILVSSTNEMPVDFHEHQVTSMTGTDNLAATSADLPSNVNHNMCASPAIDIGKFSLAPDTPWDSNDVRDERMKRQTKDTDDLREVALSACEWADSLTNISVGDLLSGADCMDPPVAEGTDCMNQDPFCSDSFDAAIAAHISRQQENMTSKAVLMSNISSIWDGEETCDAFSFRKDHVLREDGATLSSTSKQLPGSIPECFGNTVENLADEVRMDDSAQVELTDVCQSDELVVDNSAKDFNSLADMYWPDSLGPLDLDIQSSKYHCEDMILSDSLSGLNRLIASSLDAFQNCSFFGLDKREASSTVEPREIASFSDVKISGEV